MADLTIPEELRTAAAKLRASDHHGSIEGETTNPALIQLIGNLLRAREPLATWLEETADISRQHERELDYSNEPDTSYCLDCLDEECDGLRMVRAALDVARAINGTPANAATGGAR